MKQADAIDGWLALYDTLPPLQGENEKSLTEIAKDLQIDAKTVKRYITDWIAEGKLEAVGKRRGRRGAVVEAYKLVG